jgi:DNA-binding MarR family transcriptional regulator
MQPDAKRPISRATELAWVGLMRAQRRVFEAIERDMKKAGLPPLTWYDVLLELDKAQEGKLRPFEISDRTLFAQPNLSRLIDRLEQDGLVERKTFEDDRRGQWVNITAEGRKRRAEMWKIYGAAIHKHLGAKLGDDHALQLAELLGPLSGLPAATGAPSTTAAD